MNRLLQPGDRFTSKRLAKAVHKHILWPDADHKEPRLDTTRLGFDSDWATIATAGWTEHGPDGWERKRETRMDKRVADRETLPSTVWTVTATSTQGGGYAHSPHDRYPDGHHVTAVDDKGRTLEFYQTGCFVGMVSPAEVELVVEERWTVSRAGEP